MRRFRRQQPLQGEVIRLSDVRARMAKKKVPKERFVRHPHSKERLRVIDTFAPNKPVSCPKCEDGDVQEISVVESEYPGGIRYYLINCNTCDKANWFVFLT